jgi:hypothetical protein
MYTKETRRLAFSKLMRKPLAAINSRVEQLLGQTSEISPLRYMIYSGHDD